MRYMRLLVTVLFAAAFAGAAGPVIAADAPAADKPAGVERPAVPAPAGAQAINPHSELRDKLPADCILFVEVPLYRRLCEEIAYQAGRVKPTSWQDVSRQTVGFMRHPFPRNFAELADLNGPVGMAFFTLGKEDNQPPVTAITFRIRDKQQFLDKTVRAMKGEGPDKDGLWHYTDGGPYHFAMLSDTVVMSGNAIPVKKVVDNYRSADPTCLPQSGIGGSLVFSVNLAEVNKVYGEKIRKGIEKWKQEIMEAAGQPAPQLLYGTCSMHPQIHLPWPGRCPVCGMDLVQKAGDANDPKKEADANKEYTRVMMTGFYDLYAKFVTDFLQSSDRGTLAVTLDKKGITFGFEHLAVEGSELAKSLAKVVRPDLDGLQWVPADALAAGGSDLSGLTPEFIGLMNDLLSASMKAYGNDKVIEDYIKKQNDLLSTMTGKDTYAWIPAAKEAKGLGTFIVVDGVKEPQGYLELGDSFISDLNKVVEHANKKLKEQGAPWFSMKVEPRQKAFTHGDVTVWRYPVHTETVMPEKGMANPEAAKTMSGMMKDISGEGIYLAMVKDQVVSMFGSEPERVMKAVLDNMKGNVAGLSKSPAYAQAFRTDPSGACVVGYVKIVDLVGSILSGVLRASGGMEKPDEGMRKAKLVSELCTDSKSAIGFQTRVNGRTVTGELHVPDEQIKEMWTISTALAMRMAVEGRHPQQKEQPQPPQEQAK